MVILKEEQLISWYVSRFDAWFWFDWRLNVP